MIFVKLAMVNFAELGWQQLESGQADREVLVSFLT
jgi:hypothetical protein